MIPVNTKTLIKMVLAGAEGEYTYNWDDSEYCREEEEEERRQNSLFNDDEDDLFW